MEYQAGIGGQGFLRSGSMTVTICMSAYGKLVAREKVRCGWFQVFGGLKRAGVVTGPKEPVMPPEPVWQTSTMPAKFSASAVFSGTVISLSFICTRPWGITERP